MSIRSIGQVLLLICSLILPTVFILPLLPSGWNRFPLSDGAASIAYMLAILISYAVMLIVSSLHAIKNTAMAPGRKLLWIFLGATGWGSVLYYWLHYRTIERPGTRTE